MSDYKIGTKESGSNSDFLYDQEDNFGKEDDIPLRFVSPSPPRGTAKLISKYIREDYHANEIMSAYKKGYEEGYEEGETSIYRRFFE